MRGAEDKITNRRAIPIVFPTHRKCPPERFPLVIQGRPGDGDLNNSNRHELFLLADGEQKVTVEDDGRIKNTAIFTFNKEDHTLGNLLVAHLHKYDFITFAAYKVEHPLKPKYIMRVGTDGTVTPKDAVIRCCHDIVATLDKVSREFTKEMELFKIAKGDDDTNRR